MTNTSTAKQPLKYLRICIAQFDPLLDSYVDVDVVHRDQSRPIGAALADLYRSRKVCNDRAFRKPSDTFFWVFDPKNDPRFILQSRDYIHGLSGAMSLEYLCNVVVLRAAELALPDEHGRALVVIDPFEYTGRLYEKGEPSGYHLSLLGLAAGTLDAHAPAPEGFFSKPVPTLTPIQGYLEACRVVEAANAAKKAALAKIKQVADATVCDGFPAPVKVTDEWLDAVLKAARNEPATVFRMVPKRLAALKKLGFEVEVLFTVPKTNVLQAYDRVVKDATATDSYIRLSLPA